jgi:hypothetical protein
MEHSVRAVVDWGFVPWVSPRDGGPRRVRTASPVTLRAVRGLVVWLACVPFMHALASAIHHGVATTASSSGMCMRH